MQEPKEAEWNIPEASFGRCLVDGDSDATSRASQRRRKALSLSILIEAGLLALVVLSPLITTVAQPHLRRVFYIPFAATAPRRVSVKPRPAPLHALAWKLSSTLRYVTPNVSRQPQLTAGEDPPGLDAAVAGVLPGSPGPEAPALADRRPSPPLVDSIKKEPEKRPLHLSEPIVQAQLISRVEPRYPVLARQIKLQGTVQLHAIISRDGRITSLEVVSGHPLFVQAALDAVRQWRYRPTMLNGEPVEVETTITVLFLLR